ncbi:MAG: hypothetical protein C4294_11230 [Nitrospiraceae bacterium]
MAYGNLHGSAPYLLRSQCRSITVKASQGQSKMYEQKCCPLFNLFIFLYPTVLTVGVLSRNPAVLPSTLKRADSKIGKSFSSLA